MASKVVNSAKLQLEVEVNMDKDGNPIYQKKTIGTRIRPDASAENIEAVVEAVKEVLDYSAFGATYVVEDSNILA